MTGPPRPCLLRLLLAFDVGGDTYGYGGGGYWLCGEGHGSEHGVFADGGAGEDGGVVGNAGTGA